MSSMFLECLQISFSGAVGGQEGRRRGPGGERKAPWSPPQRRKLLKKQKKESNLFPLPLTRNFLWSPSASTGWTPKVSKGRPESPLVASAEAKSPEKQKKKERLFPLPPQETCLLWEVSPACGRTRYFPRAGKYPKGAGGGQRVHVSWPPPDPPLLRNSAPLASQGRAQLGSRPSLGGPLSPYEARNPKGVSKPRLFA